MLNSRRGDLSKAVVGVVVALAAMGAAAGPASQPTSRPEERVAAIRGWVRDLGNGDSAVRDRARVELMGISRGELERLRQVVAQSRPLAPDQIAMLQEIVTHVYLAGEYDEGAEERGFLGVRMSQTGVELSPAPGVRADGTAVGVAVAGRVPGFCAYRMLEDGDVIIRLTSDKAYEFSTADDLKVVVLRHRAGETVTLDVLRRGTLIRVPVTLDHKPAWAKQLVEPEGGDPRGRRAAV
jgi:hypothetical protein